jgi:hypothetical protein
MAEEKGFDREAKAIAREPTLGRREPTPVFKTADLLLVTAADSKRQPSTTGLLNVGIVGSCS